MSIICQNVAILTTTVVRTIVTVFVSTVLSQGIGTAVPSTVTYSSASCSIVNSTQGCATFVGTNTVLASAPDPPQVQVPLTITSQYVQTQFNTLTGSSCRTVPVAQPPTPQPSQPPAQSATQPATQPTTQPTAQPTTRPTTTQPTTPPAPGITDTTYTTEYVTVTGSGPLVTTSTTGSITTSNTRPAAGSSLSRTTVYSGTGDPTSEAAFSDTAVGAAPSPTSTSSSGVPVGAIVGGVVGGVALVVLLGALAYFLFQKSVFSPTGYERPAGEDMNDQSGLYPQMQQQGGYPQDGQQHQGSTGTSAQTPQYSDFPPPQAQAQGHFYADSQGSMQWQQMIPAAAAALPAGAAAAAVIGYSRDRSNSSSASPGSHTSTAPLLNHRQQASQGPLLVPYRGYAEPAEE